MTIDFAKTGMTLTNSTDRDPCHSDEPSLTADLRWRFAKGERNGKDGFCSCPGPCHSGQHIR
jgi:hypothetical protein